MKIEDFHVPRIVVVGSESTGVLLDQMTFCFILGYSSNLDSIRCASTPLFLQH